MLFLLVVASVSAEQTDKLASGLEQRPLPYFLALVISVVGVLWSTLSTVAWWGVKNQFRLHVQMHQRELERGQELKRERDDGKEELGQERRERLKLAMEVVGAAHGLARVREDLDQEALKAADKRKKT